MVKEAIKAGDARYVKYDVGLSSTIWDTQLELRIQKTNRIES
jgi:hypothetical protein